MAEKMLRIAAKGEDGTAKAIKTNNSGNLQTESVNKVVEQEYTITLESGIEGTVISRLPVKDFSEVIVSIDGFNDSSVFACSLQLLFINGNNITTGAKNFQFEKQAFCSTGAVPLSSKTLTIKFKNLKETALTYTIFVTLRR